MTLPRTAPSAAALEGEIPEAAPDHLSGTVLVVDDERSAREVLGSALARDGYRVLTATGGKDGLRLARQERPDAIVLDVIMPDLDGWAVLHSMMTVGILIGLVIGVIAGLGGLATLALMLPFAYGMEPLPALSLIVGAYSALYFGGSISAILLNMPGQGEQVVTKGRVRRR